MLNAVGETIGTISSHNENLDRPDVVDKEESSQGDALNAYLTDIRAVERIDPDREFELGHMVRHELREQRRIVLGQREAWAFITHLVDRIRSEELSPRYVFETNDSENVSVDDIRSNVLEEFEALEACMGQSDEPPSQSAMDAALETLRFTRPVWGKLVAHVEQAAVEAKNKADRERLGRAVSEMHAAQDRLLAARDELVSSNLRFVVSLAKRYGGAGVSFNDLIQEGNMGMMRAAEKFDPTRGARFATYAAAWIREGMLRLLAANRHPLHAPRGAWRQSASLRRVADELRSTEDYHPTESEIAEGAGISATKLRELAVLDMTPIALDDEELSGTNERFMTDPDAESPEEKVERTELCSEIASMLERLPEREKTVLCKHYGIGVPRELTLGELAEEMGVSRQRVQQIKVRALQRLMDPRRAAGRRALLG